MPLPENQYTLVYSLEVADFHTYYVTDSNILVHNVCGDKKAQLLLGEGDFRTYEEMVKSGKIGDNITPHHAPSAEYMKCHGISKNDATAFNIEQPKIGVRHRKTKTYGRRMTNAEKSEYYALFPRDALAHNLWDMRQIYRNEDLYKKTRPKLCDYGKCVQKNPQNFIRNNFFGGIK